MAKIDRVASRRPFGGLHPACDTRGAPSNGRDVYIRQLRDMKMSAIIEHWDKPPVRQYGRMWAHALDARMPARAMLR